MSEDHLKLAFLLQQGWDLPSLSKESGIPVTALDRIRSRTGRMTLNQSTQLHRQVEIERSFGRGLPGITIDRRSLGLSLDD